MGHASWNTQAKGLHISRIDRPFAHGPLILPIAQLMADILKPTDACPECGAQPLVSGAKFCSECGHQLIPPPARPACVQCGLELKSGCKFCSSCGFRVSYFAKAAQPPCQPASPPPPPRGAGAVGANCGEANLTHCGPPRTPHCLEMKCPTDT